MNRTSSILALAAVSALTPAIALAQSRSLVPAETLEVMLQRQDTTFNRMDLNHDGVVTSTEIQATIAQARAQGGERGGVMFFGGGGGGGAPGGPGGPGGAGGPGGPDGPRPQMEPAQIAERMIQGADTDGDGQLSRAEMRASATRRFQQMDKNGDGVLSDDERPPMRFRQGGQGAPGGAPRIDIPSDGGGGGF